MSEPVRQIFSNGVPKEVYDRQSEKIDILEEVLKFSVAEQIKRDRDEIERLKQERDTLKGKAESFDKQLEEIKKAYNKAKANLEISVRAEKEQQLRDFKYNTNSKKIKPLEDKIKELESELNTNKERLEQLEKEKDIADKRVVEVETLLKSRDEEIERLINIENKIDTIYEILNINFEDIKTMLKNNESKEVIIEAIDEMEETVKNKVVKSKEELEAEDREIAHMLKTMSDSEVADIIYKHLDNPQTRRVQLSKRKKTQRYIKIANEELVGN